MSFQGGELAPSSQVNFTTITSLISGFLLLAVGFFSGWYWQNASVQDVVRVEIVEKSDKIVQKPVIPAESENPEEESSIASDCLFVGSKNSDKYHIPTSASAERIKAENRVCFTSEEQAEEEGYEPGTLK